MSIDTSRMEGFERIWIDRFGGTAETAAQHRFTSQDGYRLPGMASHYRTYCATLDAINSVGAASSVDPAVIQAIEDQRERV